MKITKKQGSLLFVGTCVVVISIYAYQSANLTNNDLQNAEKSQLESTLVNRDEKPVNSPQPDSIDLSISKPPKVALNEQGSSTLNVTDTKVARTELTVNNNERQHSKPADHDGNRHAKHHGHEHEKVRRHPEDNSIIPPGEPKKPLPKKQGEGNQ